MAIIAGRQCRVFLGDWDISHMCRGVHIEAEINSLVTTKLELICGVSFVDGVLVLDGQPRQGPLVVGQGEPGGQLAIRGITFGPLPTGHP